MGASLSFFLKEQENFLYVSKKSTKVIEDKNINRTSDITIIIISAI